MTRPLFCAFGLAILVVAALFIAGCSSAVTGTQFQVSPSSLNFGEVITSDRLEITFYEGVEDQTWYITNVPSWLQVLPMSGTGSTIVTVNVIRQNLRPDTYTANLQIQGSADLVIIPVTMKVQ